MSPNCTTDTNETVSPTTAAIARTGFANGYHNGDNEADDGVDNGGGDNGDASDWYRRDIRERDAVAQYFALNF